MIGVSGGRDFPAEPSEEDFRLGLRSGIVLCNVLNKVSPGSVSKVVEAPDDVADGAALCAFQYFENIRNFLVAVEELGLPSFEASDMEKGGKSIRIVSCILALKSYSEWKLKGGTGPFRYGSNMKNNFGSRKPFLRKSSEPFMSSMSRTHPSTDQPACSDVGQEGDSRSINALVRSFISERKHEDIPSVVESVLHKVMEEIQQRLSIQNEMVRASEMKSSSKHIPEDDSSCETVVQSQQSDIREHEEAADNSPSQVVEEKIQSINSEHYEEQEILLNQEKHIQELKQTLYTTKTGMKLLQKKYQEDFLHLGTHLNGLAYAATGYKRVLEENRKLYNLVQDLKGNFTPEGKKPKREMATTTSEMNDLSFSVVSIVEDVLQQHSSRSSDAGLLVPRRVEESSLRRYEAAGWLREMIGVSGGRDFPAEPSEEDFRLGLRSGIVLCNVLNKASPGSVSKVVEAPDDVADGAALCAFQYFENIRNFLVAVEELGLPSFEASDMEKGGKSIRIVNCILALKSYSEWKLKGGTGPFRYGSNMKNNFGSRKPFLRKSSEPFMSSMSRTHPSTDQPACSDVGQEGDSRSINALVRSFISERKHEDIPSVVESVLHKVMEEIQQRLSIHNEMIKSSSKHIPEDDSSCEIVVQSQQSDIRQHEEAEDNSPSQVVEEKIQSINSEHYEEQEILLNQEKHIQASSLFSENITCNRFGLSHRHAFERNGGKQDFEVQSITDNESDGVASDCSDSDLMWRLNVQVNVPRVSNKQSSANPKPKKIKPKTTKVSETRSLIPSLIPAPSKRPPNTVSLQPQRPTRDGRRRLSLGK
ncbi:hypothetical protein F2Q68_00036663 [Brassica cretica]|uniref:Calponin-homology (CH) domain-containing protein n=1 Tax=Brassica cretica TaxID=69181 RepID=A0A8S9H8V5_BRACR|nr:hypothetical protein F2Q68_00036663 [Brassica cretica]